MKYYIIYSNEGATFDPNGYEIENCQILDWVKGNTPDDASDRFKEEQLLIASRFKKFLVQEVKKI